MTIEVEKSTLHCVAKFGINHHPSSSFIFKIPLHASSPKLKLVKMPFVT